jgi:hypothetical protein
MEAFQGFSQGGGRGISEGIAGVLTSAAAFDPDPISKTILGIGAGIANVIHALLGDRRQDRANAEEANITNEQLAGQQYKQAPITITQDAETGNAIAYNKFGQPTVSSDLKPAVYTYQQAAAFDPFHPQNLLFATNRVAGFAPSQLPTLSGIPGHADGGDVFAGMPTPVGELGEEWFLPRMNGTILPHEFVSAVRNSLGQAPRDFTPQVQSSVRQAVAQSGDLHVHVHASAMDAKSIIDRSRDIASAVSKELNNGNHRIQYDVKRLVSPV